MDQRGQAVNREERKAGSLWEKSSVPSGQGAGWGPGASGVVLSVLGEALRPRWCVAVCGGGTVRPQLRHPASLA